MLSQSGRDKDWQVFDESALKNLDRLPKATAASFNYSCKTINTSFSEKSSRSRRQTHHPNNQNIYREKPMDVELRIDIPLYANLVKMFFSNRKRHQSWRIELSPVGSTTESLAHINIQYFGLFKNEWFNEEATEERVDDRRGRIFCHRQRQQKTLQ